MRLQLLHNWPSAFVTHFHLLHIMLYFSSFTRQHKTHTFNGYLRFYMTHFVTYMGSQLTYWDTITQSITPYRPSPPHIALNVSLSYTAQFLAKMTRFRTYCTAFKRLICHLSMSQFCTRCVLSTSYDPKIHPRTGLILYEANVSAFDVSQTNLMSN